MDEAWVFGQDAELSKRFEFSFRKRGWPETVYIGFCRDTSHAALEFMVKRWSPNCTALRRRGWVRVSRMTGVLGISALMTNTRIGTPTRANCAEHG